jgi:hypothetical protein
MTPTGAAGPPPISELPGAGPSAPRTTPFSGTSPAATALNHAPDADNTQRTIMGILIGAVILLSIMVAVLAATLRRTNVAAAQPCVAAPTLAPAAPAGAGEAHLPAATSVPPPPSATVPANNAAPPANAPTSPATPPAEVVDYLKFVQGIDQRRMALMTPPSTTPPAASNGTPSTTPATGANETGDWQTLTADFQNHSVPDGFGAFAGEYMTFLVDCQSAAGKPADQLTSVATEATRLDGDLTALCSKLKVVKPFTIAPPPAQPTQPAPSQPQLSSPTPTSTTTPANQP